MLALAVLPADLSPSICLAAVQGQLAQGSGAVRAAFNAASAYKLFMLRRGLSHFVSGLGVDQLIFSKIRGALVRCARMPCLITVPCSSQHCCCSTAPIVCAS